MNGARTFTAATLLVTESAVLVAAAAGVAVAADRYALGAAGAHARYTTGLYWAMTITLTMVFVLLSVVVFWSLARRRRQRRDDEAPNTTTLRPAQERTMRNVVATWTAVTALILVAFLVLSFRVESALEALNVEPAAKIKVTGRQWWWKVEYLDPVAANVVTTANEIHIPVGRSVHVQLLSDDVIHSFWVPSLAGKQDLIPGRHGEIWLHAERAGDYAGQCAEFCGAQHAHMQFVVVAEEQADFDRWLAAQREPAVEPTGERERRGEQHFMTGPCAMCHTISGTPAGGRGGPDLTHLASRRRIGAGSFPNVRGHLARWVTDAPSMKPGTNMPRVTLEQPQLDELVAYLESLR
jgi:cytochrome c oxidase subunit 2